MVHEDYPNWIITVNNSNVDSPFIILKRKFKKRNVKIIVSANRYMFGDHDQPKHDLKISCNGILKMNFSDMELMNSLIRDARKELMDMVS